MNAKIEELRRKAGGKAIRWTLEGLAQSAAYHPNASPSRHGLERIRDISYGPGNHQNLDVWRPVDRGDGPLPVILYIHGGGFRILSKESHWIMALALARRPRKKTAAEVSFHGPFANAGALRRTLRLSDAVVHARRVRQPVLCMLAVRDDIVPPTGAAAIYNALASDPGLKRRALIERGHAEPSREDARRIVEFERRTALFLHPRLTPLEAISS